ncbi:hypothetical protein CVV26_02515 [Candidatus Kuenenbacteria bacterium HGW-Kuenenbacteria-1]|uniref:Uncharacterized protein n=1 Tax=Candidatus Kuenenbacteria bacterium HGW-Kuenenbacteria-1 TaxID=2013812 RepID=A0A2N1UN67_9BACT|nr:MAG: hypothetical protein CVV26_02515 [Candidatus Kuenenbacteria bacterium HGW-Kuenenbacteria-1]
MKNLRIGISNPDEMEEIKKEINKEGWDDSVAVLIGKKEEMPALLEQLESGGRTVKLETYIRLHKEIALPFEEVLEEDLKKAMEGHKGEFYLSECDNLSNCTDPDDTSWSVDLRYFDKANNLACIRIATELIAELKEDFKTMKFSELPKIPEVQIGASEVDKENRMEIIRKREELKESRKRTVEDRFKEWLIKIGFAGELKYGEEFWKKMKKARFNYLTRMEKKNAERKKEEFDF